MKFRTRVLLSQAPLGLTLILVCLLSLATLARLAESSRAVLKDNFHSVLAVEAMKESLERLDSAALLLMADEKGRGLALAAPQWPVFEEALRREEGNVTESGEAESARELRRRWIAFRERFEGLSALRGAQARRYYFTAAAPAFEAVKETANAILAMNQNAMRRKDDQVNRLADKVGAFSMAAAGAALLVGLLLSSALTARVLRPLNVLSQALHRIGAGDWDARVRLPGRDELSQLARDVNAALDRLKAYRESSLGELLQASESAQAVLESLPDPVVIFGVEGGARQVNAAARGLGLAEGPLPGDEPFKALREALERVRDHVLSGRGPYAPRGFEEALRLVVDGEERYFLPRAAPVYESRRSVTGAAVVLRDVTRAKRVEELKGDWVATVAHEFKTPLTSLRMAIHLCLEGAAGPVTDKQTDLLHAGREDCERLQGVVDELIDLSRLSSVRMELRRASLSAETLLRQAVKAHQSRAKDKGVLLRHSLPEGELSVLADPDRLPLVLSNLVANAVRYTPEGGSVSVSAQAREGRVRFEVADTGPGVPAGDRERIFEKFYRGTGADGGAGLGLYIAREIVVAHGGEIGVGENPGGGSVFWFTLGATS